MKNYTKIIFILFVSLFLVSCGTSKKDPQPASEDKIAAKSTVTITQYYEEPQSINDKKTIVLGDIPSSEYVEIVVQGKIADFEIMNVDWDSGKNEAIEKEITNQYKSLENTTVVLKTMLPEGIPTSKVKWKSISGKGYEYLITDLGLADKNDTKKVYNME